MVLRSDTGDDSQVLVIGGETAKGLATHLAGEWPVRVLTTDEKIVERTASDSFEAFAVDFEATDLKRHAAEANTAIVVPEHDRVGLLVTQLLTAICGLDSVLTRVDDPKNKNAFDTIDCEIIETGALLRPEVEQKLAPPSS